MPQIFDAMPHNKINLSRPPAVKCTIIPLTSGITETHLNMSQHVGVTPGLRGAQRETPVGAARPRVTPHSFSPFAREFIFNIVD